MRRSRYAKYILTSVGLAGAFIYVYKADLSVDYSRQLAMVAVEPEEERVVHLDTPEPLKAVYMTSCFASSKSLRSGLVDLIESTELNAVIIDIKDYTGTVSFDTGDPQIDSVSTSVGSKGCRVDDMEEFVEELHGKNIYVIGRVTVFQDPLYSELHPELAVKKLDGTTVWRDRKGLSFIDVGAKEHWDYILSIALASEKIGVDEINFDYIRYPSDGDMTDISFTHTGSTTRAEMVRQFFAYLDNHIKDTPLKTSADLFGMVTTNHDDLGIGQVLENALPYFDYVAPMVYPSHYPPQFNGWPDPNAVPYDLIYYVMSSARDRAELLASTSRVSLLSTTTLNQASEAESGTRQALSGIHKLTERQVDRLGKKQLRPWLQDFDYPVRYTAEMVRDQIQATYDAGLTSWMLWDPSNRYTKEALLLEN